jgi:hypothetical protein
VGKGSEAYLVIILDHHKGQFALFKIHFGNLRPSRRESILKSTVCSKTTHQNSSFLSTF